MICTAQIKLAIFLTRLDNYTIILNSPLRLQLQPHSGFVAFSVAERAHLLVETS